MTLEISKSLELPDGFQSLEWLKRKPKKSSVFDSRLADKDTINYLKKLDKRSLYLYTQHEIFQDESSLELRQTRTSPNWEGGIVTYSTCKHNFRCYKKPTWIDTWIAGLAPAHLGNCLMFVGRIAAEFDSNYALACCLQDSYPEAYTVKRALSNPRGDLYTPKKKTLNLVERYNHRSFIAPRNHTRSVEYYKKSPGSDSEREDGLIPKWWRDIEYQVRGVRPPSFILSPCYVFPTPLVYTSYNPKRATLKLDTNSFAQSLHIED